MKFCSNLKTFLAKLHSTLGENVSVHVCLRLRVDCNGTAMLSHVQKKQSHTKKRDVPDLLATIRSAKTQSSLDYLPHNLIH